MSARIVVYLGVVCFLTVALQKDAPQDFFLNVFISFIMGGFFVGFLFLPYDAFNFIKDRFGPHDLD